MKYGLIGLLLLAASPALAQQNVPVIAYDSVPNLLKMPTNMYLGEVSGVAVNSKGHIFVLSRGNTNGPAYAAAAAQLLEFDGQGKFIREIGKNLYAWSFAHAVKIDPQDNIWVTDKGSDMVIKFDPEGHVLLVFGRKQEASDEDTGPVSSSEASCLRPNTISTRPSGSNLITMSEPLSVTQILSCGSILTVWPNDQA